MSTKTSYFMRPLVQLMLAAMAASVMMVVLASPAQAASLTVTTRHDELNTDGDCSLREAITAANTNAAVDGCAAGSGSALDTIQFAVGRDRTLTLDSAQGELLITDGAGLTINGQTKNITISANDAPQVRVFRVEPGAVFNLRNLTVVDGNSFGSGLFNNGGTVKVINSTFSGNSGDGFGGAIVNDGTMTVTNSTFSENSATFNGGAIENDDTLTVTNSTFSENSADGGVGGGIYNQSGTLKVTNSTFSGNSAAGGGGIFNDGFENDDGTLTVTNSTFSGNNADDEGGGIANSSFGTLKVFNSTISGNSANNGGGTFKFSGGTFTLKNTIVANSLSGGDCSVFEEISPITDGGYNLIEDGSCLTAATSRSGDPMLGDLAANGGPTQTMALQAGSKAIDKGKSFGGATTDQRGQPRPVDIPDITNRGDGSDIGAYEVQP